MDNTNIGDLDENLAGELFPGLDGYKLVVDREDPVRYLRKFVDKAIEWMTVLLHTNSMISGSTASAFFAPGANTEESDIDIYCPGEDGYIVALTFGLSKLGVQWDISNEDAEDTDEDDNSIVDDDAYDNMLKSLKIIRGTITTRGIVRKVQVMWAYGKPASSNIVLFHSTITQCFISGFCAVSMYHNLTRLNRFVHWGYNDASRFRTNTDDGIIITDTIEYSALQTKYEYSTKRSAEVADKYATRGFKYTTYRDMICKFTEDFGQYPVLPGFSTDEEYSLLPRLRKVDDRESYIVPFSKYNISSDVQDINYIHLCTILVRNICWQDSCGSTTSINPSVYTKSRVPSVISRFNNNTTLQLVLDAKLTLQSYMVDEDEDEDEDPYTVAKLNQYEKVRSRWENIVPWAIQLYNPYSHMISYKRYATIC